MTSPWLEIIIGVSIAGGGALVIYLGRGVCNIMINVKVFIKKVNKALDQIDQMRTEGEKRKKETQILFESQLIQLEIMGGAKINGKAEELRRKIAEFNIYN